MMRKLFVLFAVLGGGASACGPNTASDVATLRVVSEPATARVYVDERFVGVGTVLAERPAGTTAGTHRVTVEADGFFPHDVEVALAPGETNIHIALRRVPE